MENKIRHNGREKAEHVRLMDFLIGGKSDRSAITPPSSRPLIGVIEGTGIGPEVIAATLHVLKAVEQTTGIKFEVRHNESADYETEVISKQSLPDSIVRFCTDIFAHNGAILSGPVGGRYVYDIRKQFDLFCKFIPVLPWPQLAYAGCISPQCRRQVDMLLVRDNVGGIYQGTWLERTTAGGRIAEHSFSYHESQVRRLAEVAARSAAGRRGKLHVIVKQGGMPAISALWRDVCLATADKYHVEAAIMNVDLAAYELIQNPSQFDVLVTPNLMGDILADITGALLGSRGVAFSGNFDANGRAVYQTNHGCAHDIAGSDIANPAGQILSLAMLLRESFGLVEAADLIEDALAGAWSQGWRTADLAEPGCRIVGTKALADYVAQQVPQIPVSRQLA
jgi:3-isopropylmalate dehydrogenase